MNYEIHDIATGSKYTVRHPLDAICLIHRDAARAAETHRCESRIGLVICTPLDDEPAAQPSDYAIKRAFKKAAEAKEKREQRAWAAMGKLPPIPTGTAPLPVTAPSPDTAAIDAALQRLRERKHGSLLSANAPVFTQNADVLFVPPLPPWPDDELGDTPPPGFEPWEPDAAPDPTLDTLLEVLTPRQTARLILSLADNGTSRPDDERDRYDVLIRVALDYLCADIGTTRAFSLLGAEAIKRDAANLDRELP